MYCKELFALEQWGKLEQCTKDATKVVYNVVKQSKYVCSQRTSYNAIIVDSLTGVHNVDWQD